MSVSQCQAVSSTIYTAEVLQHTVYHSYDPHTCVEQDFSFNQKLNTILSNVGSEILVHCKRLNCCFGTFEEKKVSAFLGKGDKMCISYWSMKLAHIQLI